MTGQDVTLGWAGERRLAAYLDGIAAVLGHASRVAPARAYCTGLLLPGERKSVEPMAARLEPGRAQAAHQWLHHVVAKAQWDDAAVLGAVRGRVLPAMERHGPVAYWIVDDTAFPKQGKHSAGVARQYCGRPGKQDSCQVAVSLSVANDHASNDHASLPVAYQLYLPEAWAEDPARRRAKAGVPGAITFETKAAIALGQMRQALADGVPEGIVLGDAGYGDETEFRAGVGALGLRYVLGVRPGTTVWPPGTGPLPPAPWSGRGRPPTRLRRGPENQPVSPKDLAESLPPHAWRTVTWREGSQAALSSRLAALRVRPAHRDTTRTEPWPEEWLLVEGPQGEAEPTKYWLSTLPPRAALKRLVHVAKARWRIERDYQELKQEIGLGHYEGRGWRGFHHHASLWQAGAASTTTPACASQPTASWSPSAAFPPPSPPHAGLDRGTRATPRFPATRRRRGQNATSRTPSPRSDVAWPLLSSARCRVAHAAFAQSDRTALRN